MSNRYILASLSLLAVTMLLMALGLSASGLRPSGLALPAFRLPAIPLPAMSLPDAAGIPVALTLSPQLIAGAILGWTLRWLYGLPWAAYPRAAVAWLLGWRRSVVLASLAVVCMAVLLLY